jgi:hypothetical protein
MTIDSRDSDEGDLYSDAIRKYSGPDVGMWEVSPDFRQPRLNEAARRRTLRVGGRAILAWRVR